MLLWLHQAVIQNLQIQEITQDIDAPSIICTTEFSKQRLNVRTSFKFTKH